MRSVNSFQPDSDTVTASTLLDDYGIVTANHAGRWTILNIRPDSWAAHQTELLPSDLLLRFDGQPMNDDPQTLPLEESQLSLSYQSIESGSKAERRVLLPYPLPSVYGVQTAQSRSAHRLRSACRVQ